MRTPGKAWNLVSERSTTPLEGIRRRIDTSASGPAYSMKASSMIQSRSGRAAQQGQAFSGRAEQPRRVAGIGQKHRRTRGRFGKPGQQIAGRLPSAPEPMPPQSGLLSSPARRQASAYSLNAGSTMETQGAPRLLSTRARAWMSSLLPLPKAKRPAGRPYRRAAAARASSALGEG